jgi:hypothetical protein
MPHTAIAYWLMPAEPARCYFEKVIADLAAKHDAPVFKPHLTIYVGSNRPGAIEEILLRAAIDCEPIQLEVLEVRQSDEFTKTLFVQFGSNAKLQRLNETICEPSQTSSDYQLEPHLSLLYKKMPILARRELAGSIKLPFSTVVFDSIKAVRCVSPTCNRADVEAWRIIATKALSG